MLIVDTVSSLSTVDVDMDANGIDVMLAGVQKALALPPGLAVFAVSEAGMERAKGTPNRGYYFDFQEQHPIDPCDLDPLRAPVYPR